MSKISQLTLKIELKTKRNYILPIKKENYRNISHLGRNNDFVYSNRKWPNYDRKCSGQTDRIKEKQQERKREKEREEMLG